MATLLTVIHIFAAIVLIVAVLLQSGKGGMGATFGGAATQIFGGRGAGNFLTRVTTTAAITFFATSLTLSMLYSRHRSPVEQSLKKTPPAAAVPAPTPAPEANTAAPQTGAPAAAANAPVATPAPATNVPAPKPASPAPKTP
jgi:preprotein translocase subunit SecG